MPRIPLNRKTHSRQPPPRVSTQLPSHAPWTHPVHDKKWSGNIRTPTSNYRAWYMWAWFVPTPFRRERPVWFLTSPPKPRRPKSPFPIYAFSGTAPLPQPPGRTVTTGRDISGDPPRGRVQVLSLPTRLPPSLSSGTPVTSVHVFHKSSRVIQLCPTTVSLASVIHSRGRHGDT